MRTIRRRYICLSAGLLCMAHAWVAQGADVRTIFVVGQAEVATVPDQVSLSVGIDITTKKVEEAKTISDEAMRQLLSITSRYKIDKRDVLSDYTSIQKTQEYGSGGRNQKIVYNAHRDIRILLRNISKYDDLVAALFASGTNNLNNVTFHSSEADKLEAKARMAALDNAKIKAAAIAEQMGLKLGRPLMIAEGIQAPPPIPMRMTAMAAAVGGTGQAPTLAPGEMTFRAQMSVTFEAQ